MAICSWSIGIINRDIKISIQVFKLDKEKICQKLNLFTETLHLNSFEVNIVLIPLKKREIPCSQKSFFFLNYLYIKNSYLDIF